MSSWKKVGGWLKENADEGAALVGSLLTGNVVGAVAAGAAMVSSATGKDSPDDVLQRLQTDPASMVRLKELAYQNEADIRRHLESIQLAQIQDEQHQHATTQATIQAGDRVEDRLVRWTRPGLAWFGVSAASVYALVAQAPDAVIFGGFMTMPYAYLGLREIGKGIRTRADVQLAAAIHGARE